MRSAGYRAAWAFLSSFFRWDRRASATIWATSGDVVPPPRRRTKVSRLAR